MIKMLLISIVMAVLYYYLSSDGNNPEVIENPVYGEIRINFEAQGRIFKYVLFAEMANQTDCVARAALVWSKALSSCKNCQFQKTECRDELPSQYGKMFNNIPVDTTYLTAQRGNRYERNGRIVIWGLTGEESVQACEMMKTTLKENYQGSAECIRNR